MGKKSIAFFDFDGTITSKDTFLEFIKFCKGNLRFYIGFLLYSPILIAFKLKLMSNQVAKEIVLRHFFGKMREADFQEQCNLFSKTRLPSLIRPKALREINRLEELGAKVVIVSASPQNWLSGWAQNKQIDLIGTSLEIKNERITGNISGKNCYGEEKVRRIKEAYTLSDYQEVTAYGDTSGDIPMLKLADFSFFKPFR